MPRHEVASNQAVKKIKPIVLSIVSYAAWLKESVRNKWIKFHNNFAFLGLAMPNQYCQTVVKAGFWVILLG